MSRIHRRNPRHGRRRSERKGLRRVALKDVGDWLKREFPPAYTREALLAQHEKMVWLHDLLHAPLTKGQRAAGEALVKGHGR